MVWRCSVWSACTTSARFFRESTRWIRGARINARTGGLDGGSKGFARAREVDNTASVCYQCCMAASDSTTLYLRGVPRRIVRQAKAAAASAGKTLGRWVSEQLEHATEGASGHNASADTLRADTAWFERNRHQLERKYSGEYIAIVEQRVVDHDTDFDPLARRMFEQYGVRPICMPKVGRGLIRVRSPRKVRR